MGHASLPISKAHHAVPSDLGVEYRFLDIPLPSGFPVLGVSMHELEPQSQPVSFMHMHRSLEIGYCFEGTGIVMVEDRVMSFQAGDVSVINNAEMHMGRGASNSHNRWGYFWLDPALLLASIPESAEVADQTPFAGAGFANIISPREHPEVCQTVRALIEEIPAKTAPAHRILVRSLAGVLMSLLHRMQKDRATTAHPRSRLGVERVSPALRYLANHYAEEADVEELASLCHLSHTHFYRVFLAAVGTPPLQYLARLRVRMAAGMLREHLDLSVTQVASAVGFDSINTFNRQFRQTIHMTPSAWRRHQAV